MLKTTDKQPASSSYQFLDKLGEGQQQYLLRSFGYIWKVRQITTGEIYACKMVKNSMIKEKQLLLREIKILQKLKGKKGISKSYLGFTQLVSYGQDQNNTYFVMNLLGENLEQLRLKHGNFNNASLMSLAMQTIQLLQNLHANCVVHRDIKPENFVVFEQKVHLIDFGLSKLFVVDGEHIEYKENKGMIGTARYASIHALKGHEQSRRDDLESVGYLLIYLMTGTLPWMNINSDDKSIKYLKIQKMKEFYNLEQQPVGIPLPLIQYFQYVRTLQFQQLPDYNYLIGLFSTNIDQQILSPRLNLPVRAPRNNSFVLRTNKIKLKTIQMEPHYHHHNTCRQSPERRGNTSRRITFEELSSEGGDILSELHVKEDIKLKNLGVGIIKPMHSRQPSQYETELMVDEFDDHQQTKFKVPITLMIK